MSGDSGTRDDDGYADGDTGIARILTPLLGNHRNGTNLNVYVLVSESWWSTQSEHAQAVQAVDGPEDASSPFIVLLKRLQIRKETRHRREVYRVLPMDPHRYRYSRSSAYRLPETWAPWVVDRHEAQQTESLGTSLRQVRKSLGAADVPNPHFVSHSTPPSVPTRGEWTFYDSRLAPSARPLQRDGD